MSIWRIRGVGFLMSEKGIRNMGWGTARKHLKVLDWNWKNQYELMDLNMYVISYVYICI